jgi:hypothetical protein
MQDFVSTMTPLRFASEAPLVAPAQRGWWLAQGMQLSPFLLVSALR